MLNINTVFILCMCFEVNSSSFSLTLSASVSNIPSIVLKV